jgi:PAS domain S-box-containing protein
MDLESIILFLNEYSPWGIFILDNSFKILFWNEWLEINTKIKKEDAINKDIFELIPHTKKFENYFTQVLNGGSIILSQRFHKYLIPIEINDEELKYMQQTVQMFPLIKANEIKGVIAVIEDVTDRVKKEEELIEKFFEGIIKISNAPK